MARPSRSLLRLLLIVAVAFTASDALAHRSGCHRWHSCPSDHGTYVCGDLGHCSGCLDNQYCLAGQPQLAQSEPRGSKPESQQRPGVPPKDAWTCPSEAPIKGNFTTYSGERCIYHPSGGQFYGKTKPERCYDRSAIGPAGSLPRVPGAPRVRAGPSHRHARRAAVDRGLRAPGLIRAEMGTTERPEQRPDPHRSPPAWLALRRRPAPESRRRGRRDAGDRAGQKQSERGGTHVPGGQPQSSGPRQRGRRCRSQWRERRRRLQRRKPGPTGPLRRPRPKLQTGCRHGVGALCRQAF